MQLWRILGINFQQEYRKKQLYEKTGEKKIPSIMRKATWELFGHILKRDRNIPAYKAMPVRAKGFRSKPRIYPKYWKMTNKYYAVNMVTREHNYCHRLKLNNIQDLEETRNLAQNRKWVATSVNGDYVLGKQRHLSMKQQNYNESSKSLMMFRLNKYRLDYHGYMKYQK